MEISNKTRRVIPYLKDYKNLNKDTKKSPKWASSENLYTVLTNQEMTEKTTLHD